MFQHGNKQFFLKVQHICKRSLDYTILVKPSSCYENGCWLRGWEEGLYSQAELFLSKVAECIVRLVISFPRTRCRRFLLSRRKKTEKTPLFPIQKINLHFIMFRRCVLQRGSNSFPRSKWTSSRFPLCFIKAVCFLKYWRRPRHAKFVKLRMYALWKRLSFVSTLANDCTVISVVLVQFLPARSFKISCLLANTEYDQSHQPTCAFFSCNYGKLFPLFWTV